MKIRRCLLKFLNKQVFVPKSLPNNANQASQNLHPIKPLQSPANQGSQNLPRRCLLKFLKETANRTIEIGADRFKIPDVLFNPSLAQAVATSPIGGEFLTDSLLKNLEHKGISIKPRYAFKKKEIRAGEFQIMDLDFPNTTESYKLYSQRVIVGDIKECVCRVPDTPYDRKSF